MTLKRTFLASLMAGCLAGTTAWAQPPVPGSPEWDRFRSFENEDRYEQRPSDRDQNRYQQDQQRFEQDRYRQDQYQGEYRPEPPRMDAPSIDSRSMQGSLSPYLAGKLILMNKQCIALSQEAADRANSRQVRQFAQMTVEEHQKLMRELQNMVGSDLRQELTAVDLGENRRQSSYFRGEPGTQQERADAERLRDNRGVVEERWTEERTTEERRTMEERRGSFEERQRDDTDAAQDDRSESPFESDAQDRDEASAEKDRPEGTEDLEEDLNEEVNEDLNEELNRDQGQDENEGQDENATEDSDLNVNFQTDEDDQADQEELAEQPERAQQDDRQNVQPPRNQANQPNRRQAEQRDQQVEREQAGDLEFQDSDTADRFDERQYSQEEMGDQIRRNEFRNYSDEASHSVRRPYSREAGPQYEDRDYQDRWSERDMRGPASSSVVNKLMRVECEAAKQQIEMGKRMLREQSGQDFDMAFLGMTIGSHVQMIAQLDAMQDVDSPELRQVIREARAMAEDHLAYAKHLSKQLEDQEYSQAGPARSQQQGQIEQRRQIEQRGEVRDVRRPATTQRRGVIQGRSGVQGAATIEAGPLNDNVGSTETYSEPFGGVRQGADNRAQKQERDPNQNQD